MTNWVNIISAMAHNEGVYRQTEDMLNSLIKEIISEGGIIWLQSKENKEHYYKLDSEVVIGSYQFLKNRGV